MKHHDLDHFAAVAQECAEAARRCVTPYFRANLAIESKEDKSPVTKADREAEQAMRAILTRHFPHHGILGEETGQAGNLSDEWLWILDPIDGTRSFVTGRPAFCTLIALCHEGKPVLGIIDQPITEERWVGLEGQETRFFSARLPGIAGTRRCPALKQADLSCTSPDIIRPDYQQRFESLRKNVGRTSWGGDAYGYGLLTLGQIDLIAEDTLKLWDWAALVPVIKGAGGSITDWNGHELTLASDGSVLACGDPALLKEAVKALS
ncbi:histidinol phosphate phosphatase [Acetobacteraceae bacterium ESL0709]|nr:histidinol phosphate phosphatase [Acetobacteraceae bacterium ESL0697]MDF7677882.1 histidinol phosphate phosphatase [Acetobacteraceae bacterium ESL0709]